MQVKTQRHNTSSQLRIPKLDKVGESQKCHAVLVGT